MSSHSTVRSNYVLAVHMCLSQKPNWFLFCKQNTLTCFSFQKTFISYKRWLNLYPLTENKIQKGGLKKKRSFFYQLQHSKYRKKILSGFFFCRTPSLSYYSIGKSLQWQPMTDNLLEEQERVLQMNSSKMVENEMSENEIIKN